MSPATRHQTLIVFLSGAQGGLQKTSVCYKVSRLPVLVVGFLVPTEVDSTLTVNIGLLLISTVSSGIQQSQMLLPLLFQKGCVYFLEGGAFLCVSPPAAQHDLVERFWTQPRLGQVDLRDEQ